jgi:hypothetical protein
LVEWGSSEVAWGTKKVFISPVRDFLHDGQVDGTAKSLSIVVVGGLVLHREVLSTEKTLLSATKNEESPMKKEEVAEKNENLAIRKQLLAGKSFEVARRSLDAHVVTEDSAYARDDSSYAPCKPAMKLVEDAMKLLEPATIDRVPAVDSLDLSTLEAFEAALANSVATSCSTHPDV